MRRVFADANYWIALINRNDELHATAVAAESKLKHAVVVTTDEVLAEFLNYCSSGGSGMRKSAAQSVDAIRSDARVTVIEQSRSTFDMGLQLYKNRTDKQYSLVDCVSFELMRRDGINEALTNDHHFQQEGFKALLRDPDS